MREEARLRCCCSITGAQAWGGSWREGLSCQGTSPSSSHTVSAQQPAPTAHLSWPGALAARPHRGKMLLEAVSACRSVCTCVNPQGTGLKRSPPCKNCELRHPNGVEVSKLSQGIQMAMCPLGLWMYSQIGSVFVNQYMQG